MRGNLGPDRGPGIIAGAVFATALFAAGLAAAAAATVESVALLKGPERQKILVEGAKKEGKLTWYSTLIVDQVVRPLKAAFEKEYPFVQIEFFRGNTERVVQKAVSEYRARRYDVDIIDGTTSAAMANKAGIMQRFFSPYLDEYPPELRDPRGIWGATNLYFLTPGYNTRMVKPGELPKTWEDLLQPRWKGNMIWSTSRGSGAPMMIGNILLTLGPEAGKALLLKLAKQEIAKSTASNRQILDLVIAGEHPLALHIFNHHALISRKAGAPVDWHPIEPVTATFNSSGLAKNAPHPHAAMLFLDFIFSRRGQRVFQDADYLPAHPEIPAKQADLKPGGGRFKRATYIGPETQLEKGNEWIDFFQAHFLK
ncbi:MAG TPA: ABC transporter substrate-binding protein [candidate division Zixibacteria bacterium]|nr:ABC transporter substrate-binding protein [candidate division Zixibacteria bacterium]